MSLFVAGAVLGEVQVLLFVVGAVFGECQVLLFVVGAALGECLNVRLGSKRCILQYFFCSTLLRCDLLAKKVPGRAPYSQHIMIRNWT